MGTLQSQSVFEDLKLKAASAAIDALEALQSVIKSPESRDADRIKAASQIIIIMDKAIDHLDVATKYEELKKHLDKISDTSDYDPTS